MYEMDGKKCIIGSNDTSNSFPPFLSLLTSFNWPPDASERQSLNGDF